jgi:succinoglycan biosynthesis protein ExoA
MVISTDSFTELPSVTIAIPAYNEEAYIEKVIQGFLATKYSRLVEILVADGNSSDRTQALVKQISLQDERVKLLVNPQKIQSHGLNLLLNKAEGDIFLRADAHCEYAPDYIEKCVEALQQTQADNVGGAQRFVAKNAFQMGVAVASLSVLGSGGAKYRNSDYNGYADTVYIGCFWRKALLAVGTKTQNSDLYDIEVFDTSQITNQDAELNQKLLDNNSQAIYISSAIKVWYYPRQNWQGLWIQYFKYGRGRYLTNIKHPERSQLRGKLPFLFVVTSIIFLAIDLFLTKIRLFIPELILLGIFLIFCESCRITWKYRHKITSEIWRSQQAQPLLITTAFWGFIAILTMVLAHSSGRAYQMFRHQVLKIKGW